MKRMVKRYFPRDEIASMGARIEGILFDNKITYKNQKILEYANAYLLFRKSKDSKERDYYQKEIEVLKKKLYLAKALEDTQIYALNLWLRGSRENEYQELNEKDLNFLYERIKDKLNPP